MTNPDKRAFPNAHFNNEHGMTLREYFAAKAMQGLLAADTEFVMSRDVIGQCAVAQPTTC